LERHETFLAQRESELRIHGASIPDCAGDTWCGNGRNCLCWSLFDLDSGGRHANLRASRDPSERGLLAQIVGTENCRNVSEERPQSQQADKLGTRVYRSCTKVGAVTLVHYRPTVEGVCAGTGSQFRLLGCRTPQPSEGVSPYRSGCSRLFLLLAWVIVGSVELRGGFFRCAWL